MQTKTMQHQWVRHIVVPIDVISSPFDGSPLTLVQQGNLDEAESGGVDGCAICSAPLNTETAARECPGYDEEANI